MTTATAALPSIPSDWGPKPKRTPRLLTLEEFRRKYSGREDGYKYEFSNGIVQKSPGATNIHQFHIVDNIMERFRATTAFKQGDRLAPEIEQMTIPGHLRRPDLALLSHGKVSRNDESISGFVVEIISPNDKHDDIVKKRREYFRAGVKVVWQIAPVEQTVSVYTSPTKVAICEGDEKVSAAPAVPDLSMSVAEIFAKL
jgi:Uma2 family endonuclease